MEGSVPERGAAVKWVRATFNEMLIHLSTCGVKREDYVKEAGGRAVGGDEGSA